MTFDPSLLAMTQRAAGTVPADAQMAISQGGTADQIIDNAQAIQAFGDATTSANYIKGLSADHQRNVWNSATQDERNMWAGAGWKGPPQQGLLSRVGGAIGGAVHAVGSIPGVGRVAHDINNDVLHPVERDVLHPIGEAGGAVLHGLAAGNELAKHLYRTAEYHNNGSALKTLGLGVIGAPILSGLEAAAQIHHLDSSSDWADAWHRTTHGEQVFDPTKDRQIQHDSGLDPDVIGLAKAAAAGDQEVTQYLHQKSTEGLDQDQITALASMVNDPNDPDYKKLQGVVQQYKDSKLSFGRSLIPSWMWQDAHPAATIISGFGDALFSFVDPLIIGSKVNKSAKVAKYGFKTAEEMANVLEKPAARAWQEDVAGYLANKQYGALIQRYPQLTPVVDSLAKGDIKTAEQLRATMTPQGTDELKTAMKDVGLDQVDTADKLKDWMIGNQMALHILSGNGSAVNHGVNLVPTLTGKGRLFLDTKDTLNKAIDWASTKGVNIGVDGARDVTGNPISGAIRLAGTTAKRMTTLIPQGLSFKPDDPDAVLKVQRFARAYLPNDAVNSLVSRWAEAPDLSAKRVIYLDMLRNTFKSAGIDVSDDAGLMNHYMDTAERSVVRQKYSVEGIDHMQTPGGMVESNGLLEKQMSDQWALPSFKELADNADRSRFNQLAYGIANNPIAHTFSMIWKPLQLLRIGFPIRVSLEELAGGIARSGLGSIAKATLARNATKDITGIRGPLEDLNPIDKGLSRVLRTLPAKVRGDVTDVNDLAAKSMAHNAVANLRDVAAGQIGKVAHVDEYANTIKKYPELFDGGIPDQLSAVENGATRFVNDEQEAAETIKTGLTPTTLKIQPRMKVGPNGEFKEYKAGEAGHLHYWMKNLDDLAESPVARHVIQNIGDDPIVLRRKIADFIQSPDFKNTWEASARSRRLSDGRIVGQDATARQAAEDWADKLSQHVNAMLPQGEHQQKIIDALLKQGKAPDYNALKKIPDEFKPNAVIGNDMVNLPGGDIQGLLSEFVSKGFTRIAHTIDHLSREPLYISAVHQADTELSPVVESIFGDTAMGKEVLSELVRERAFANVKPFIHDPKVRSQMNVLTQNLAPFQFAQEQFWKRWAKTFYHSPEAMREAQLAHHAAGATGFTHKDDQGEEIFTYPATGFAQKALAEGFSLIGLPAALPVHQSFTGQLKMVAPGLDRTFAPSFGPLVSLPVSQLARHFKQFIPAENAILGPQGSDRPAWEQVVPSSIARFIKVAISDENLSPAYGNAMSRAIQDIYATGNQPHNGLDINGNPLPPTSEQLDQFMRRVGNWTRINLFLRAVLGFGAPAAPQTAIGDTKIGKELRQLADSGMGFSQAIQAIMKRDPDAYPYAVFMSEAAGKEPLPATTDAAKTLEGNRDFFTANKEAGGFFLPQQSSDSQFSSQAYKEQLIYEMRKRRTPSEYIKQLEYSAAAGDYYDTRDAYNERVKNLKGAARDVEANNFQTWKAQYLKDHPIFADKLTAATGAADRAKTMEKLHSALIDPRAPKNEQTSQIQDLIDTYDSYQSNLSQWSGMRSAVANRNRQTETANFATWAKGFVKDHPGAIDVYNSLIRPDVEKND